MRGTSSVRAQLFQQLIGNLVLLLSTLTAPALWSTFANEQAFHLLIFIFQAAQALNLPYNGTYYVPSEAVNHSASLLMSGTSSNPAQNLTNHAFEAITGADNFVDIENHVVIKYVLGVIVDVARTVTPTVSYLIEVRVRELVNPTI